VGTAASRKQTGKSKQELSQGTSQPKEEERKRRVEVVQEVIKNSDIKASNPVIIEEVKRVRSPIVPL
jgi:hypothetical protein